MRKWPLPALFCLFFLSCKKDPNNPGSLPFGPNDTLRINLNYPVNPPPGGAVKYYELIISEPGGTLLLDTTAPINTSVRAALATKAKLVDVTTVRMQPDSSFAVMTYRSVDPSTWVTAIKDDFSIPFEKPSTTMATMHYNHVPPYNAPNIETEALFTNFVVSSAWTLGYTNYNTEATVNYSRHNGNYAYFLIPMLGLYDLHVPKGDTDTVDLSHMDTAAKINFKVNDGLSVFSVSLNGIFDTTDLSTSMSFFKVNNKAPDADLEYPPVPVQKYELNVYVQDVNQDSRRFYNYGNTIPETLHYPDGSAYTISSAQKENFTVKFNIAPPTLYATNWTNGRDYWTIYASPDSGTIHPMSIPVSVGTKMIKGAALSSVSLRSFYFATVTGFSYADYFRHVCDPASIKTRRVTTAYDYYHHFF